MPERSCGATSGRSTEREHIHAGSGEERKAHGDERSEYDEECIRHHSCHHLQGMRRNHVQRIQFVASQGVSCEQKRGTYRQRDPYEERDQAQDDALEEKRAKNLSAARPTTTQKRDHLSLTINQ